VRDGAFDAILVEATSVAEVAAGFRDLCVLAARAPTVLLSAEFDWRTFVRAIESQARGYVVSVQDREAFLDLLDRATARECVLCERTQTAIFDRLRQRFAPGGSASTGIPPLERELLTHLLATGPPQPSAPPLTPREEQIVILFARGLAYKEIEDRLALSHSTMRKLAPHLREVGRPQPCRGSCDVVQRQALVGNRIHAEPALSAFTRLVRHAGEALGVKRGSARDGAREERTKRT
jgi:DNA-binding NarL/FixJ family response regulator